MNLTLVEYAAACRVTTPAPRACDDAEDLAWWFAMFALALEVQRTRRVINRVSVTVKVHV